MEDLNRLERISRSHLPEVWHNIDKAMKLLGHSDIAPAPGAKTAAEYLDAADNILGRLDTKMDNHGYIETARTVVVHLRIMLSVDG